MLVDRAPSSDLKRNRRSNDRMLVDRLAVLTVPHLIGQSSSSSEDIEHRHTRTVSPSSLPFTSRRVPPNTSGAVVAVVRARGCRALAPLPRNHGLTCRNSSLARPQSAGIKSSDADVPRVQ